MTIYILNNNMILNKLNKESIKIMNERGNVMGCVIKLTEHKTRTLCKDCTVHSTQYNQVPSMSCRSSRL